MAAKKPAAATKRAPPKSKTPPKTNAKAPVAKSRARTPARTARQAVAEAEEQQAAEPQQPDVVENGIASEPAGEEGQMEGLEVMQPLFPCDGSSAQKVSHRPDQQSEPEDA